MTLALAADAWAALAIAIVAAAWLVRRAVGTLRVRSGGGGCCASKKACGSGAGPTSDDLRRAASRGAARVNRG